MLNIFVLFICLSVNIVLALYFVNKVYSLGYKIYSFLVGFLSFLLLIVSDLFVKNQWLMYFNQIIFLLGIMIFFISASKNYHLLISGKGKGWLSKKVKRLKEVEQK